MNIADARAFRAKSGRGPEVLGILNARPFRAPAMCSYFTSIRGIRGAFRISIIPGASGETFPETGGSPAIFVKYREIARNAPLLGDAIFQTIIAAWGFPILPIDSQTCFVPPFCHFLLAIRYARWPFSETDESPAIFINCRKIADNILLLGDTISRILIAARGARFP